MATSSNIKSKTLLDSRTARYIDIEDYKEDYFSTRTTLQDWTAFRRRVNFVARTIFNKTQKRLKAIEDATCVGGSYLWESSICFIDQETRTIFGMVSQLGQRTLEEKLNFGFT